MEDKRTAFAVILSILVLLVYQRFISDQKRYEMAKYTATVAAQQTANTSSPVPNGVTAPLANSQAVAPVTAAVPAAARTEGTAPSSEPTEEQIKASATTVINSALAKITVNHLGARISRFELNQFKVTVGSDEPLNLVSHQPGEPLPLGVYYGTLNDSHVQYTLERSTGANVSPQTPGQFEVPSGDSQFVFLGTFPNGATIRKTIVINPDTYLFKVLVDLQPKPDVALPIWLEWAAFVPESVATASYNLYQFKQLTTQNKIAPVLVTEVPKKLTDYGNNQWVSFSDTYFISSLIPSASGLNTKLGRDGDTYLMRGASEVTKPEFSLFVGPKSFTELQKLGLQLERNVDLGWFSFLAHPLLGLLRFLHSLLANWGLAIIALTLIVKIVLLPLAQVSFKSMKAMQDLQPEIKALRERIKDPTELNQEMLALYKKRGVNPMGGCFPMLLQIPVFLGLYNALLNAIELRHAPFALWINDLASPERLEVFGIGVPVMILIMGASMFVQQWTTPTAADPAQKKAMMLMPFMFTGMFIVFPFPSGLVLYWLVNNLISIVQQVYIRGSSKASPFQATLLASLGIFALGYVVTLL